MTQQSSINPDVPEFGLPMSSSVVRNNFLAAYNDINTLFELAGIANYIWNYPISSATPTINQVLTFNGTEWVPAAQGSSFSFSIASFSDGQSSQIQMGSGTWKASGSLSFSASYNNGPATSGTVSMSGAGNAWSPNSLILGNTFQGPTVTTQNVNYPSSPDTNIVFTLSAGGANGTATRTISHTFNNNVYYGVSTQSSGFTASQIMALGNNPLQGSRNGTFTVNAPTGDYIVYAYPARYGTATFTVGGFSGGFNNVQTLSITNASGYIENYYVWTSTNSGLGNTTVTVT